MVGAGVRNTHSSVREAGISGHCEGGDGIAKDSAVLDGDGMDGGTCGWHVFPPILCNSPHSPQMNCCIEANQSNVTGDCPGA